jgi:hypothetical protein
MFKIILIGGGVYVIYLWAKSRHDTGQTTNETVRALQGQINDIQVAIYQAAVAQAGDSGQQPRLYFHELDEDGVLGLETRGAVANLQYFVRALDPVLLDAMGLRAFYSLDREVASAGQIMTAIEPLFSWSQNIGSSDRLTVAFTMAMGDIYLSVAGGAI